MKVRELSKKSSPRIDRRYLRTLGVQAYGYDNLYPQSFKNIISSSSTGAECNERFADFIEGNGFSNVLFSEYVVNRRGETVDDVHALVCSDLACFGGFAIHVNYNLLGEITELHHIPFENCRLVEEDDNGYVSKVAIHPDWSGKKTRKGQPIRVDRENIDYIDVFNPDVNVVLAQMEAAGGVELYKGQVMWVSMAGRNVYPVGKGDRVATEMSTDEGLANVKYRNVRCNFFPSSLIFTRKGQGSPDDDSDNDSNFSDTLLELQGDTNAGKMLEVELESEDDKPEVVQLNTQNYDKEFTVTDASVVERIYSAYGQEPWYCIRIGKVGFSGDILNDAFEYYNSIVSKQQRLIERVFSRIFGYWYEVANTTNDYSIQPLKYVKNGADK